MHRLRIAAVALSVLGGGVLAACGGPPGQAAAGPAASQGVVRATVGSARASGQASLGAPAAGSAGSEQSTAAGQAPSIGNGPYLDDRSTPQAVVQSYYNAVNRREYARAYGYWEAAAAAHQWPSFDQFQRGYQDTSSVQLKVGAITGDVGAGQLYYSVPVVLETAHTDGGQAEFAGCYRLHLARAELQAAPPFQPLSIQSANLQAAPPTADQAALLAQACREPAA